MKTNKRVMLITMIIIAAIIYGIILNIAPHQKISSITHNSAVGPAQSAKAGPPQKAATAITLALDPEDLAITPNGRYIYIRY